MEDVKAVKSGWFNAFRPWTLHGAVIPVLLGGAVAYEDGHFCWWIFLLIILGGCLLQSAANLLNTYGDYVRGTDTAENHSRSPELVTGTLSPKKVLFAGFACLGVTALCGLVFVWYIGWGIIVIGLAGMAGAGLYTVGLAYKYHGLGLPFVFFMMGILMPLGTYYVLTGDYSLDLFLLSLPNAFMITAVLSGNEVRDYYSDREAGVGTISGRMQYENAMKLYLILNLISFPILAVLLILQIAPWPCALVFITLFDFRKLYLNSIKASENPGCNRLLVPMSFNLNWHFGVLLVVGYLIGSCLLG